jgi:hypothetical protein
MVTLLEKQMLAIQAARAGVATDAGYERELLRLEWHIKFIKAEMEKN